MQQVYLKRMTKQDVTKSVTVCTESVERFWGLSKDNILEYIPIRICSGNNPTYFPDGITIHKGYVGEKDWRITGSEFKKLYTADDPKEKDIMCVVKNGNTFSLSIIKQGTGEYSVLSSFFKGNDNYVILDVDASTNSSSPNQPLQQIFYGAPGTGKSYKIDEATRQAGSDYVFRTTFHPDSDYSTFVGAYKPTMVMATRYGLNGSITVPYQVGGKDLMENRIEYRFVKQAFTKTYIKAWKEFMNAKPVPPSVSDTLSIPNTVELIWRNQKWVLLQVNKNYITYAKEEFDNLDEFKRKVLEYWGKMPQPDAKGRIDLQKGAPFVPTACMWYYKKCVREGIDVTTKTAEECLSAIMGVLESGGTIVAAPNTKSFSITLREDVVYYLSNEDKHAYRDKIKETYNNVEHEDGSNVRASIAKKLADYKVEFDVAWDILAQEVNGASDDEVSTETPFDLSNVKPVYLIIEEINRGNCAQIFGDLFQLLDRSDYGFSCYPILSDEDIRQCLTAEDKNDDPSFGVNGLSFTEEQAALINSALKCDADVDVAEKIAKGEVLVLPPNLYIWATMNTSDQSLFPIDSAFKRRWEWTYMPIKDHREEAYRIVIGETSYDWWGFLEKINHVIGETTSSEDKQLGYFFAKSGDKIIDAEKFVGKVIFYLWNDVFKNYGFDSPIFSRGDNKNFTFSDFFNRDGKPNIEMIQAFLAKLDETIDKEHSFVIVQKKETEQTEEQPDEEVAEQAEEQA